MTETFMQGEYLLEPDEARLIDTLRDAIRKVEAVGEGEAEFRAKWEADHPGEFYAALSVEGSPGGKAYSECPEAMVTAALAAFNLVAKALGVSGWQASYAEMEFLRRSRRIEGPWGIYTWHDALYPQYDVPGRIAALRYSPDIVRWLGDEAERLLAEKDDGFVSPQVQAHWRCLVAERDLLPATDQVSSDA